MRLRVLFAPALHLVCSSLFVVTDGGSLKVQRCPRSLTGQHVERQVSGYCSMTQHLDIASSHRLLTARVIAATMHQFRHFTFVWLQRTSCLKPSSNAMRKTKCIRAFLQYLDPFHSCDVVLHPEWAFGLCSRQLAGRAGLQNMSTLSRSVFLEILNDNSGHLNLDILVCLFLASLGL